MAEMDGSNMDPLNIGAELRRWRHNCSQALLTDQQFAKILLDLYESTCQVMSTKAYYSQENHKTASILRQTSQSETGSLTRSLPRSSKGLSGMVKRFSSVRLHKKATSLICDACGIHFTNLADLASHKSLRHDVESQQKTCSKCLMSFASTASLNMHYRSFHKERSNGTSASHMSTPNPTDCGVVVFNADNQRDRSSSNKESVDIVTVHCGVDEVSSTDQSMADSSELRFADDSDGVDGDMNEASSSVLEGQNGSASVSKAVVSHTSAGRGSARNGHCGQRNENHSTQSTPWTCERCLKSFGRKRALSCHIRFAHKQSDTLSCDARGESFHAEVSQRNHSRNKKRCAVKKR